MPHARRWQVLVVVAGVLAVAIGPVAAGRGPATAAPAARVVLYGDSLPWEAQSYFRWPMAVAGVEVRTATFGGTALCDWIPRILDEADETDLAVISVSGNSLSPCMLLGPQASPYVVVQRMLAEAEALTAALAGRGTRVLWVGPPKHGAGPDIPRQLAAGFATIPARHANASYVDAGDAVAPGGIYRPTLSCLPFEGPERGCQDGRIRVRSGDGIHFCPGDAVAPRDAVGRCAGWSSGAARFGWAMAAGALRVLVRT